MISINLLPPEVEASKKQQLRKRLINQISIAFIGFIILITIGAIVYGRIQISRLASATDDYNSIKNQVGAYKEQEIVLVTIQTMLKGIVYASSKDYNQIAAYGLVGSFLPQDARLLNFSIDKTDKVNLSIEASGSAALQSFFDNLTNPTTNQGKISKINVNSLSQSSNNKIRFEMDFNVTALQDKKTAK